MAAKRAALARRRKALGPTQETLAELLGVERSTVVRWESGETAPAPWMRSKLAKALKLSPERTEVLLSDPDPVQPGAAAAVVVPRQLPAAVADFTGRAAELRVLNGILDDAVGGAPGTVVISAIGGTAGVGKTTLALNWAHQVTGRFPDGQLHVNLRGFDPSGIPVTPAEAVRTFLDALGVPPERVPAQPDAQAGLYRSMLADRRMLIVLDNARDEEQVRPLLPASPGSLVLVTSRNQLAGLAAADGARLLSLDVLSHGEATALLATRVGAVRAAAEPDAIEEIARLCACLPLALAVAAARAAVRPRFLLSALAAELRDAAGRLDALDSGDPAASVRAVFSWSYEELSDPAARMFRLLGLHPGPDIGVAAAASLAAVSVPRAGRLLGELSRAHLITEHAPGRYAFHDLLRSYAAAQAHLTDSDQDRKDVVSRVIGHYLHTASQAGVLLNPAREEVSLAPPAHGVLPEPVADDEQAMAWFRKEHEVLLATVSLAAESGFDAQAWHLPCVMTPYLSRRGHIQDWAAIQQIGLAAATRLGDVAGQAQSSRFLGFAYNESRDYEQALRYFTTSLELYGQLGNRLGEARVRQGLCVGAADQGRYAEALDHGQQALGLFRAVGHKHGEAALLESVGWLHGLLGDYQQARELCRQALAVCAETGDRVVESNVWDSLGYIQHQLGDFAEAITCYRRALGMLREFGFRYEEANTLAHIGDTCQAAGDLPEAREAWHEALVLFEEMQHPDAEELRAKLAAAEELSREGERVRGRRGRLRKTRRSITGKALCRSC